MVAQTTSHALRLSDLTYKPARLIDNHTTFSHDVSSLSGFTLIRGWEKIEAETKWPTIYSLHLKCISLHPNFKNFVRKGVIDCKPLLIGSGDKPLLKQVTRFNGQPGRMR